MPRSPFPHPLAFLSPEASEPFVDCPAKREQWFGLFKIVWSSNATRNSWTFVSCKWNCSSLQYLLQSWCHHSFCKCLQDRHVRHGKTVLILTKDTRLHKKWIDASFQMCAWLSDWVCKKAWISCHRETLISLALTKSLATSWVVDGMSRSQSKETFEMQASSRLNMTATIRAETPQNLSTTWHNMAQLGATWCNWSSILASSRIMQNLALALVMPHRFTWILPVLVCASTSALHSIKAVHACGRPVKGWDVRARNHVHLLK